MEARSPVPQSESENGSDFGAGLNVRVPV